MINEDAGQTVLFFFSLTFFSLKRKFFFSCLTINGPRHEKTIFCICENKATGQLRGYLEADQRPCFRYIDSTIPLLSKFEISSL